LGSNQIRRPLEEIRVAEMAVVTVMVVAEMVAEMAGAGPQPASGNGFLLHRRRHRRPTGRPLRAYTTPIVIIPILMATFALCTN
jgi:hypothetical protein